MVQSAVERVESEIIDSETAGKADLESATALVSAPPTKSKDPRQRVAETHDAVTAIVQYASVEARVLVRALETARLDAAKAACEEIAQLVSAAAADDPVSAYNTRAQQGGAAERRWSVVLFSGSYDAGQSPTSSGITTSS